MDVYEENLLRLNKKIRELMSHIDTLETKNQKLLQENSVLVDDVANFRVQHAIAEEGRLRCKSVLEKEMARSSEQFEAQKLLKKRYNDLIKEYVAQNQKLRAYESQDNAKPVQENRKKVPVEIIGTLSDIGKPKAHEEKVAALENRCAKLEKELYKAYAVIDDLEFDLESIDHLEETNQRLEKQIRELKAELAQGCRCAPPTPTSANSLSSPLPGDSIYTFESIETTDHGSQQDESKETKEVKYTEQTNVDDSLSNYLAGSEEQEHIYSNITRSTSNTDESELAANSTL